MKGFHDPLILYQICDLNDSTDPQAHCYNPKDLHLFVSLNDDSKKPKIVKSFQTTFR